MTSRLSLSAALLALACAAQSVTFGAASDAESLYQQALKAQYGQGAQINLKAAQDLLEQAAAAGSAMAMQRLGDMYHDGDGGVARDFAKAVEWYQKEAALDDSHPGIGALGMLALAGSYEHGHGVTADKAQADALYAKALKSAQSGAAKGDTSAMIALAYCLAEGKGLKADPVNAWQWAIKSSETPNSWAYEIMASMYSQGAGVPQDDGVALRNTLLAAQMGVSQDIVNVSLCYANGIGVKKDPVVAVEWIRKAVERGNGRAMGILGKFYHEGIGIDRSDMTARDWYQKAVDLGDPAALGYMGDLLIAPGVNPRDSITAASWFDKGAKAGDASSMFQLAELLIYDTQVPRDVNRAVTLLMEASNLGFGDAMDAMGEIYRDRILTPGTQADAMTWFRRAAAAGSPVGMRNLAELLSYQAEGSNASSSDDDDKAMFAEAVDWLKKAAALGDLEAVTDMGDAYLRGKGVGSSATTAITWYRKAADAGNVRAMRSLGKIYAENRILADYKEAFNWYTKAANYGDPPSISGLAELYDDAMGTREDNNTAYRLYSQAAELGDAGGYWGLGRFLQEGTFVPQDLPRAASFYQVSANGGDIRSMEALGRMYELGQGVPKDLNRAMALYRRAADLGSLSAINWVFSHSATSTAPGLQDITTQGARPPGSSTAFPTQPGGGNRGGGGGGRGG